MKAGSHIVETEAAMFKFVTAALALAAIAAPLPALEQQTPAPPAPAAAAPPAVRHLVYRFGYNTKAADSGTGTGTTTIDIGGVASDGGLTVTATDDWWNTVKPRQSFTCELYSSGSVTCAQAPYAISPIQIAIVPLLGQSYFAALSAGSNASWKQSNEVRATFFPGATSGFAGQVYTWKCDYTLTGKGTVPDSAPLIFVQSDGAMKQQGGRSITVNQKANIAFDPRIQVPVFIDEEITFIPRLSINRYTIQLKLIKT